MTVLASTARSSQAIKVPLDSCIRIARGLSVLEATALDQLREDPEGASSVLARSAHFYAKLPPMTVEITIEEMVSVIRSLCQHGITLFGAGLNVPLLEGSTSNLWGLCQLLSERYVSWHYCHCYGFSRSERLWDGVSHSHVGTVYQAADSSAWEHSRETIVIGEPCPICATGRLILFVHPDDDGAGVRCNAGCIVGGASFGKGGFGKEVRSKAVGRTRDELAIWREPTLPRGMNDFLPYQQLGCPVL